MDLQDQLKLFPDHEPAPEEAKEEAPHELYVQKNLWFANSKRKVTTVIEGYEGSDADFKILAKEIKTKLSVGGTFKDDSLSFKEITAIKLWKY
jgi:translation initiation factor 1